MEVKHSIANQKRINLILLIQKDSKDNKNQIKGFNFTKIDIIFDFTSYELFI